MSITNPTHDDTQQAQDIWTTSATHVDKQEAQHMTTCNLGPPARVPPPTPKVQTERVVGGVQLEEKAGGYIRKAFAEC